MHNKKRLVAWNIIWLTMLALVFVVTPSARSQTYQVIHRFIGPEGASPYAGLTMDAAGRLYGTTIRGGTSDYGTVFKLTHSGSDWVLTPLYHFTGGSDGGNPLSRVIFGPDGGLYGTTPEGGSNGFGTVFNLRPPLTACKISLCIWTKTTIQAFDGSDGDGPVGDLIFDGAGNLYGATYQGGQQYNDKGVVYRLTPSKGSWTETVLYDLPLYSLHNPLAGVTLDQAGNLYGTVEFSGDLGGYGAVFQLTPSGAGWTENPLFVFQGGNDGGYPQAGVIFDNAGNLYGGTPFFGAAGGGTVFELMPSNGGWAFSLLYGFAGSGNAGPHANLVLDGAGNLYGTTFADGAYGLGSVFKLTPGPGGWTYTSLHDFTGGNDGANPVSNVIFDASGNLFGTASAGAQKYNCYGGGCGVVWEITP